MKDHKGFDVGRYGSFDTLKSAIERRVSFLTAILDAGAGTASFEKKFILDLKTRKVLYQSGKSTTSNLRIG